MLEEGNGKYLVMPSLTFIFSGRRSKSPAKSWQLYKSPIKYLVE